MAEIVLGIGTSHTPMISMPPEYWSGLAENDHSNRWLVSPRSRSIVTFDELLAETGAPFADLLTVEYYERSYEKLQVAVANLSRILLEFNPDVVVIVSDDQGEWLFDDVMPRFMIYWGDTAQIIPREHGPSTPLRKRVSDWGYGDVNLTVPVEVDLARHMIGSLLEEDFDIAHSKYMRSEYGGTIGPSDYMSDPQVVTNKRCGLPHGFAFVIRRLMNNEPCPIVPVFQNTVYPPNQPTARRSYAFGRALRRSVATWGPDKRVCFIASGGLSHQVLDEEADTTLLNAIRAHDAETLSSIPHDRLIGASSESQNWITVAGACEAEAFNLVDYVPIVRSEAGTGGGWAFGYWSNDPSGRTI